MRNASAHKPCSASAHAQGSAGDTHSLRDGDKSEADEREQAAAMLASGGSQIHRGSALFFYPVALIRTLHLLSHNHFLH